MEESDLEGKQVDGGGVLEGWREDRCASTPKPSYRERDNLNLKQTETKSANVATLSNVPQKRKKSKAPIL